MNHIERILLAFVVMKAFCVVQPIPRKVDNLLLRPYLSSLDTTISMACFSNYIAISKRVSETFGQAYNQCLLDAKAGRQATEAEMLDNRIAIQNSSQDICKRLSTCDNQNTTLEFLDCHAKNGESNTKAIYSISGNASEHASVLQENYRILDIRHEQCCKTAERRYVESTAVNYRNLQDCLDGRMEPVQATMATTPSRSVSIRSMESVPVTSTTNIFDATTTEGL